MTDAWQLAGHNSFRGWCGWVERHWVLVVVLEGKVVR